MTITLDQIKQYTPKDKSWLIRMGIMDITSSFAKDVVSYLDSQDQSTLGGDLKTLRNVADRWGWRYSEPVNVGESGTIYRFVKFYSWMNHLPFEPIVSGTLVKRSLEEMTNDQNIINYSPEKLLTLDGKTTQWATMQYLLALPSERRKVTPMFNQGKNMSRSADFKLRVTYDAVEHWTKKLSEKKKWESRIDPTFLNQQIAFVNGLLTGRPKFIGEQAEDYCFERAFDLISEEEGRLVYPSVEKHETNRFTEMERALQKLSRTGIIDSKDHRVVQALVMRQIVLGKPYEIVDKSVVNKTWPKFWDFIDFVNRNDFKGNLCLI